MSMQFHGQLRHGVTKKVIKAAYIHVLYESHLRTCLWNGFQNCPGAAQHCLPNLIHPIQLVSSLEETEMGPKKKRVERKYDACQVCITFSSDGS